MLSWPRPAADSKVTSASLAAKLESEVVGGPTTQVRGAWVRSCAQGGCAGCKRVESAWSVGMVQIKSEGAEPACAAVVRFTETLPCKTPTTMAVALPGSYATQSPGSAAITRHHLTQHWCTCSLANRHTPELPAEVFLRYRASTSIAVLS